MFCSATRHRSSSNLPARHLVKTFGSVVWNTTPSSGTKAVYPLTSFSTNQGPRRDFLVLQPLKLWNEGNKRSRYPLCGFHHLTFSELHQSRVSHSARCSRCYVAKMNGETTFSQSSCFTNIQNYLYVNIRGVNRPRISTNKYGIDSLYWTSTPNHFSFSIQ